MLSEELAEKLHNSKIMEPYDGDRHVKILKSRILVDLFHFTSLIVRSSKTLKEDWKLGNLKGIYTFEYEFNNTRELIEDRSIENVLARFILKHSKKHH